MVIVSFVGALLCSIIIVLFSYMLYTSLKNNQKWAKLGVPHVKPYPLVGNCWRFVIGKVNSGDLHKEICDQFPDAPFVGFYDFTKPKLLIKDTDLLERIMVKDFHHFEDHGFLIDDSASPLDQNLFLMNGDKWRAVRYKFSPMFTTGKLRNMNLQISDITTKMIARIEAKGCTELNLKDVLERFAMDVIGTVAFGFDPKSLIQDKSEFRDKGEKLIKMDITQFIIATIAFMWPEALRKLNLSPNPPGIVSYFAGIVSQTMRHRKKTGESRNDFLQMMMILREKGKIELTTKYPGDEYLGIGNEEITGEYEITEDMMLGHAVSFLSAGFSATSITMLYACYELAAHPEIQDKVRNEVIGIMNNGNDIDYEHLKKMTYLDCCIKESMRLHSAVPFLFRVCTKKFKIPGSSLVIENGDPILIPTKYIHYNPALYPNPKEFIPERFEEGPPKFGFLPFGEGPRICLAMRFALLEIRCALARLLLNYRITLNPKTTLPLETDKRQFFNTPKNNLYFDMIPLKTN